jgi:ubiquinone biosynthesis protein
MHISLVLLRYGLDDIILAAHLFRPIRFVRFLLPWNWFREARGPRGERIRLALEALGPIFVKFGQMLSTRRDLLADDLALELAKLQDRVPPFPGDVAVGIVETDLGSPVSELFARFEFEPMASASVAQVHAATLQDGREVIVKVLRPDIAKVIERDLQLLYIVAELAQRYWPEGRRLRPVEVVSEYEKTILDELDLVREAGNASQLRRNFTDSQMLYVPEVHWPLTRRRVMVMERIHGVPIGQIEELRRQRVNMKRLSERGVKIFFTQVFRDSFFHADMHPGNIFVDCSDPEDPRYIAVDFGIVGTLSPGDQHYLAQNLLAFFRRDYRRVAELHIESGWVPSETRVDEFESAIRSVCEPIFDRPLQDISFGAFLLRLFQTARRFNMEVQPQLVLLQKTLLNIEGLGRQLYPQLDLWSTAKPYLEEFMKDRIGAEAFARGVRSNLPLWAEQLPEIPGLVHGFAKQATAARKALEEQRRELVLIRRELRRSSERSLLGVLAAACVVGGVLIVALDGLHPAMLGGAPVM